MPKDKGEELNKGNELAVQMQFEDVPQRWEYLVHVAPQENLPAELLATGNDGWELIQAFPCAVALPGQSSVLALQNGRPQPQAAPGLMLIMKRPKAMLGHSEEQLKASVN